MKKLIQSCFILLILAPTFAFASSLSPLGYWQTIDDVTGKVKSIIHITKVNNSLQGRIVKIYPNPGRSVNEVCSACIGPQHNQRIVGMTIMTGLRQSAAHPNEWSQGKILDPTSGKLYRCQLHVTNNGEKLTVRGYIGIAMFGRSQTWVKIN